MELMEAIRILDRAGRGAEVIKSIETVAKSADLAYRGIREDSSRSEEWKKNELAAYHASYRQKLADELIPQATRATQDDRRDYARVFGTAGISGEPASLAINQRDAMDRVSSVTNATDLLDLLTRATRSGDEVLARAAVQHATEHGMAKVMNAFIADRPELEAPAHRLWAAQNAEQGGNFNIAMALMGLRP